MTSSDKPSFKQQQWVSREQSIRSAARRLLTDKGYAAMTLEEVAAAVGISKPTLYQHFRSKEELGVTVLVQEIDFLYSVLYRWYTTQPPQKAVHHLIHQAVDRYFGPQRCIGFAGMLPLHANPELREAERRLTALFAAAIASAQENGSVSRRVPSQVAAQTLFSILKDPSYTDLLHTDQLELSALKNGIVAMLLS